MKPIIKNYILKEGIIMRKVTKELNIVGEGKEDIIESINKCTKFFKKEAKKGKYDRFFVYVAYSKGLDIETNVTNYKSFCKGDTGFEEFVNDVLSIIEAEKEITYSYVSVSANKES